MSDKSPDRDQELKGRERTPIRRWEICEPILESIIKIINSFNPAVETHLLIHYISCHFAQGNVLMSFWSIVADFSSAACLDCKNEMLRTFGRQYHLAVISPLSCVFDCFVLITECTSTEHQHPWHVMYILWSCGLFRNPQCEASSPVGEGFSLIRQDFTLVSVRRGSAPYWSERLNTTLYMHKDMRHTRNIRNRRSWT